MTSSSLGLKNIFYFDNYFNQLQTERVELLKHLLNNKVRETFVIEDDDVIKMAMDTAGSNVRDIVDYINKKIFKAVKNSK